MAKKPIHTVAPPSNVLALVTISTTFPLRDLGVSSCGDYFQIPYSLKGEMRGHAGETITTVNISRGKITVPTLAGRNKWAAKNGKSKIETTKDFSKLA